MSSLMRSKSAPAPAMRAGDADRDHAVEQLSQACAEGRLTLGELDERAEAAYQAQTIVELDRLLADIPSGRVAPPIPDRRRDFVVALFGSNDRRGDWTLTPGTVALSVFGSSVIDLRDAVLEGRSIHLRTVGVFGAVDVIVPPGVPVTVGGRGVFGSVARLGLSRDRPIPGAPHVHIEAVAVFGSVQVRRVRPPLRERLRRRR